MSIRFRRTEVPLYTVREPLACKSYNLMSIEIAYNFKYVARHGRTAAIDPYSVRQTGIFHAFQTDTMAATWILLQP